MNNVKNKSRPKSDERQRIMDSILERAEALLLSMVEDGQKGKIVIHYDGSRHANIEVSVRFPVFTEENENE